MSAQEGDILLPLVEWVSLDRDVYLRWCSIGDSLSLSTHSHIATFLLDSHQGKKEEDRKCLCNLCGSDLAWLCRTCLSSTVAQPDPLKHEELYLEQGEALHVLLPEPSVQEQAGSQSPLGDREVEDAEEEEKENDGEDSGGYDCAETPYPQDHSDVTDKKLHVCSVCSKSFPFAYLLQRHEVVHTKQRNHFCEICLKTFRFVDGLRRHKKLLHPEQKDNEEENDDLLEEEIQVNQIEDTPETLYSDSSQPDANDTTGELSSAAVQSIKGENSHKCNLCSKSFPLAHQLQKHKVVHGGNRNLACDVCHKRFRYMECLKKHRMVHMIDGQHRCEICSKTFSRPGSLQQHITKIHKRFECDVCQKTFCSSSYLKQHKLVHTGQEPCHVCEVCGKAFQMAGTLRIHKKIHQGRTFLCELCNKAFSRADSLKTHMLFHSKQKPHMCDQCGKGFYTLGNLIRHRRVHTGEKPHVCDVCNAAFADLSNLNQHKARHTQEKPYLCNVCNRAFPIKNDLKQHKKTHSNVKPHSCNICGMAFVRPASLRLHKRTHSAQTVEPVQHFRTFVYSPLDSYL